MSLLRLHTVKDAIIMNKVGSVMLWAHMRDW